MSKRAIAIGLAAGVIISVVGMLLIYFSGLDNGNVTANNNRLKVPQNKAATSTPSKFDESLYENANSYKVYDFEVTTPAGWTSVGFPIGVMIEPPGRFVTIDIYGFSNADLKSAEKIYANEEKNRKALASGFKVESKEKIMVDGLPAIEAVWSYIQQGMATKKRFILIMRKDSGYIVEYTAGSTVYNSPQYNGQSLFEKYDPDFSAILDSLKIKPNLRPSHKPSA